ncbi:MAG: glycosyltransferase family 2 protein [Anaerolineales bacterium]|jgi:GT2 family glycosyltransferase
MVSAKSNNVEVAVIILTMNQRDTTLLCLTSFYSVHSPPYRILLWDNGSQDGTAEAVRQMFPQVMVHHHYENIGVASGRNVAAKMAIEAFNPAYLFFMDNDMTVTPDFLEALVEPFGHLDHLAQTTGKIRMMGNERRIYGAGGCRINFWLGDTRHVGYTELDRGQYDEKRKCIPSGGCMMVRADVFTHLGGFDGAFDPYGPEDLDFGLRVARAGYYGLYVPEAIVFHDVRPGRTISSGQYTENYAYHRVRNWFLFMDRHASPVQKLGFLMLGLPSLLIGFVIRQSKRGNLLASLRALGRGTYDYWKSSLKSRR